MFGGVLFCILCIHQNLEGLGKIKSYDISIVWIHLSHFIFGVWLLWPCPQVSRPLPSLTGNLLPFISRSRGYSWRKSLLIRSLPVSKPLFFCTHYPHLGRFYRVAPFPSIYLWCPRDRHFLFSFYLIREVLWSLLRFYTLFFKSLRYHLFLYLDPSSPTQTRDALLMKY